MLERLYPHGNIEVMSKLDTILTQRKNNLTHEYSRNNTQRKLTRDQMLNFQKLLKDEARLYYDEIVAVVLDFHTRLYE